MKKAFRYIFIGIILVAIIVGYYYYLNHRKGLSVEDTVVEKTEVEKILDKDFEADYPATPREVLKNYNRIITAYYNEEYDEEQFLGLATMARQLMDEELLELNPEDAYLADLRYEIATYKDIPKTIVSSSVSDSNDVVYKVVKGHQCAYADTYYFCKEGTDFSRTYEKFVLRKDKQGNWKILAWKLKEPEEE
ncbi:MAG: hypothetical protein MJ110_05695 [Lachnospiraceae bacterium]|nr:hypothetical protein [Lachnospiraceae bacterium]